MNTLNRAGLEQALTELWENREGLIPQQMSQAAEDIFSRFEMRIDDLIAYLIDIKKDKGNVKVLKPELFAGTMHLVNIHVQQRRDCEDEWVLSIY